MFQVFLSDLLNCHCCIHSSSLGYETILMAVQISIGMYMMQNSIFNLSNTFRAILSKLIGRYFDASLLSSFPGFIIGTMLDFFHCFGKQPSLRHLLYMAVRKEGRLLKTCRFISLVSPSSPGAFLGLNFFIADSVSSREKGLSSSVSVGSFISSLISLWTALSSFLLSSGTK